MPKVVVASQNPAKLEAARRGFQLLFPGESFDFQAADMPSEVSSQPRSSSEAQQGALNRATAARQSLPQADYWVGIEGGVEESGGQMAAFAWVVVLGVDRCGQARSASFFLPPAIAELVRQGFELGEADDRFFGRTHSNRQGGAVGLLSGDRLTRADLISDAVALALLPFRNPALYV